MYIKKEKEKKEEKKWVALAAAAMECCNIFFLKVSRDYDDAADDDYVGNV